MYRRALAENRVCDNLGARDERDSAKSSSNRPSPRTAQFKEARVANTKSAIKDIRQSERRRQRNRTVRSRVRTSVKTARAALAEKNESTTATVRDAIRALDKAVTKGVIHRNTAARKKSSLARALFAATSASPSATS